MARENHPTQEWSMDAALRPGRPEDADACGTICYEAFTAMANQHNFPPDFPSREVAVDILRLLLSHPGFYAVVAEVDGHIVGSNVLDERSTIAGLGPITVEPSRQNSGVGRRLMEALLERAAQRQRTWGPAFCCRRATQSCSAGA
jgi:predicted N-acetyltransferase YhbS